MTINEIEAKSGNKGMGFLISVRIREILNLSPRYDARLYKSKLQRGSISSSPREITLALGYYRFHPARSIETDRASFVKLPINVNASNNSSKLCFLRTNDVARYAQTDAYQS